MNETKTLKQLGWKIYKKRQNQIIYQKYSSENLLILRKSEKYVELKKIIEEFLELRNETRGKKEL